MSSERRKPSREQTQSWKAAFALFAEPTHNTIAAKNLLALMNEVEFEASDDEIYTILCSLDPDNTGTVTCSAFIKFMVSQLPEPGFSGLSEEVVKRAFVRWDVDDDGYLGLVDIRKMMSVASSYHGQYLEHFNCFDGRRAADFDLDPMQLSSEELQDIIDKFDADGDGKLDMKDYARAMGAPLEVVPVLLSLSITCDDMIVGTSLSGGEYFRIAIVNPTDPCRLLGGAVKKAMKSHHMPIFFRDGCRLDLNDLVGDPNLLAVKQFVTPRVNSHWWRLTYPEQQRALVGRSRTKSDIDLSHDNESPATFTAFRCVFLVIDECRWDDIVVRFMPLQGPPIVADACIALEEGQDRFASFETRVVDPVSCSEVTVTSVSGYRRRWATDTFIPPFRIDASPDSIRWLTVHYEPMPWHQHERSLWKSAFRCFIPHSVPINSFGSPSLAAPTSSLLHNMHLGHQHLKKELSHFLCGNPPVLQQWPGKETLQRKVVLWLFLKFVPDRDYHQSEVDWVVAMHHRIPAIADCAVVRKEFVRHGHMRKAQGSSIYQVSSDALRAALQTLAIS